LTKYAVKYSIFLIVLYFVKMKTNLLKIALEHQVSIYLRKEQYHCKCPNCLNITMELNPEQGYYCCYTCGSGGDSTQFDNFYLNTLNPF